MTEDGGLRCPACGGWHPAGEVGIDEIVRFEGDSDPADEAVLFALDCGHCEAKGTYVSGYGPTMEAAEVQVVTALLDHRRDR